MKTARSVYDPRNPIAHCWCAAAVRPLSHLLGVALLLAVGAAVVAAAGSGPAAWGQRPETHHGGRLGLR